MPNEVHFVIDTNLFHECLRLDSAQFPWSAAGEYDPIVLVVANTVLTELDNHKKDTRQRVRRRAILQYPGLGPCSKAVQTNMSSARLPPGS